MGIEPSEDKATTPVKKPTMTGSPYTCSGSSLTLCEQYYPGSVRVPYSRCPAAGVGVARDPWPKPAHEHWRELVTRHGTQYRLLFLDPDDHPGCFSARSGVCSPPEALTRAIFPGQGNGVERCPDETSV